MPSQHPAFSNSPTLVPEILRLMPIDNDRTSPIQELSSTKNASLITRIIVILTDFCTIILSIGSLALVCLVAARDGQPIDGKYDRLRSVLTTLAPIFPMIFAFILSRLLYQISRIRLEKGESIQLLEQLMGSRTLGSTLMTHFELRAVNPLTIFLLCVWAFSPLGGQSLLRILDKTSQTIYTHTRYMSLAHAGVGLGSLVDNLSSGVISISSNEGTIISLFSVAQSWRLYSNNSDVDPTDIWGNVKIPILDEVQSGQGWAAIKPGQPYSAFVGVPIRNIPSGNASFLFDSTYVQLECGQVLMNSSNESPDTFWAAETFMNTAGLAEYQTTTLTNGSWYGFQNTTSAFDFRWNLALNRFIDRRWWNARAGSLFPSIGVFENETSIEAGPTRMLFQLRNHTESNDTTSEITLQKSECKVIQKYVESQIRCSRATADLSRPECRVEFQRPSQKPHPSENLSIVSHPLIFAAISKSLPGLFNLNNRSIEFIANHAQKNAGEAGWLDYSRESARDFSHGLTQIINSFIVVNQAGMLLNPHHSYDVQDYNLWKTADAQIRDSTFVYSISWPWMAACLASCAILSLAAILSVVYVHSGKSPETLGWVSTAIRDSRFFTIPPPGRHIDAHELSILLRKERIRYGWSKFGDDEKPMIGIGLENEMERIT